MEVSEKLTKLLKKKRRKAQLRAAEEEEGAGVEKLDQCLATSCRQFFTQKVEFHCVDSSDSHLEHLRARFKPLNISLPRHPCSKKFKMDSDGTITNENDHTGSSHHPEDLPKPKRELFDSNNLVFKWKSSRGVGPGLGNLGNTCFLNSVLQCLLYTPPLYNYVMSDDHKRKCQGQGFCLMCVFKKQCNNVFNSPNGSIKPFPIVHNLKAIAKPFRQGRQEDAHEFLRYFVDGLQKSCLQGTPSNLDPHSKATTAVHKIFGGYHRSQVKCMECMKTSNTYDPLLDINLDIKSCSSLIKALQKSIQSDILEGDNCYACPYCKKMTRAQKRFTIHTLPNVLTVQLKRFEYNGLFGGKINKQINFQEIINMRPYMSQPKGPSEWYRLYAVLVHYGYSSHSGHYFCYIKNSNGIWYCMNDSQVSQVSLTTVLNQDAYLLFYMRDPDYRPPETSKGPPGAHPAKASVKPVQNFSVKSATDKTGTPLVKLPPKSTTTNGTPAPSKPSQKSTTGTPASIKPPQKSTTRTPAPIKAPQNQKSTSGPLKSLQKSATIPGPPPGAKLPQKSSIGGPLLVKSKSQAKAVSPPPVSVPEVQSMESSESTTGGLSLGKLSLDIVSETPSLDKLPPASPPTSLEKKSPSPAPPLAPSSPTPLMSNIGTPPPQPRPPALPPPPAAVTPAAPPPPKPTGIVNPSPHTTTPPSPSALPPSSSSSPPDKPITDLLHATPPGPKKSALSKGAGHGTFGSLKNFSIPLRKTLASTTAPPVSDTEARNEDNGREVQAEEKVATPVPESAKQQSPADKKQPLATPLFTPRQIVAPHKSKKFYKPKRLGEPGGAPRKVVVVSEEKSGRSLASTVKSMAADNLAEVKTTPTSTPPPPGPPQVPTILDAAEEGHAHNKPPVQQQHGFRVLPMSEQPLAGHQQPLAYRLPPLPPIGAPPPPPPATPPPLPPPEPAPPSPFTPLPGPIDGRLLQPHGSQLPPLDHTPSHVANNSPDTWRMTPFSLKPKVARVSPFSNSALQGGHKPVARVKPHMHISSLKDDGGFHASSYASTPQAAPHGSPWTVTPRNERATEDDREHHKHHANDDEDWRYSSPAPARWDEGRGEEHASRHRHKKHHHNRKSSGYRRYEHEHERRHDHTHKWREDGKKRSRRSLRSESPQDVSPRAHDDDASSSDSDGYGRSSSNHRERDHYSNTRHSGTRKRQHSGHRHHNKYRHRSPSREQWSSEERRRERKRSHSDRYHERSPSPAEERKYKKSKAEQSGYSAVGVSAGGGGGGRREGGSYSRKVYPVPEVEWDSGGMGQRGGGGRGGGGWDGSRTSNTVEELTSHSINKLGNQVRGWDGGENSIDSSCYGMGDHKPHPVRDSWDVELDKGKVKKVKKKVNDFSSDSRNYFQEHQSKRNKYA